MSKRNALAVIFTIAITLALACPAQAAGLVIAEDLLVSLNADGLAIGPMGDWSNADGSLGGLFTANGTPEVGLIDDGSISATAVTFSGDDWFQGMLAPDGLEGAGTRTVEVWAYNPNIPGEETMVSWAHRGGPDGSNVSFNYGSNGSYGAVGHWGGPDIGWDGAPAASAWHHLVYTYDGATTRVYADGALKNSEAASLNAHADNPIRIGAQNASQGGGNATHLFTGSIAQVRIHDGVLSGPDVLNNFNAGITAGLSDGTLTSDVVLGNWLNSGTWTGDVPGGVPTASSVVNVLNGHEASLGFLETGEAGELHIAAGGTVSVSAGILNISNILDIEATGALNIGSSGLVTASEASTTGITFADNSAALDVDELTINSAIDLGSANVILDGNAITIAPTGSLSTTAGGTTAYTSTGSLTLAGGTLSAAGIDVVGLTVGAPVTIPTGDTFSVSGALSVVENGALIVEDGFEVGGAGTVGTFLLDGGTLDGPVGGATYTTNSDWNFQGGEIGADATLAGNYNIIVGADRTSDGTLVLNGTNTAAAPAIIVRRGAIRDIPALHTVTLTSNNDNQQAALEVTANTDVVLGSGVGEGNITDRGGFSASGGHHTVTLLSAPATPIATMVFGDLNGRIMLGSKQGSGSVTLTNNIDFENAGRTIYAFGSDVDPTFYSKLGGTLTNVNSLEKRGDGILEIPSLKTSEAVNVYDGTLRITTQLDVGGAILNDNQGFARDLYAWDDGTIVLEAGSTTVAHRIDPRNGGTIDISGHASTWQDRENVRILNGGKMIVRNGGELQVGYNPNDANYWNNRGIEVYDNKANLTIETGGIVQARWINARLGGTIDVAGQLRITHGDFNLHNGGRLIVRNGGHARSGGIIGGGNDYRNSHFDNANTRATIEAGGLFEAQNGYVRSGALLEVSGEYRTTNYGAIEGENSRVVVGNGGLYQPSWDLGNWNRDGFRIYDGTLEIQPGGAAHTRWMEVRRDGKAIIDGTMITREDIRFGETNATIYGNGDIQSRSVYIQNSHAVSPGSIGATGTLTATVTGEFKFDNGGILRADIADAADHDLLDIVGKVNFDSTWTILLNDLPGASGVVPANVIRLIQFDSIQDGLQTVALDTSIVDANPLWDTSGASIGIDGDSVFITGLAIDPEFFADEYTWDNDLSPDAWSTGTEWSKAGFPDSGPPTLLDKAVVAAGIAQVNTIEAVHTLEISGTGAVDVQSSLSVTNDLSIADTGALTVGAGAILDQINNMTMTGGTLVIDGELVAKTLTATGGTVDVSGTVTAPLVTLGVDTNLTTGAVFNAETVSLTGGTTTVSNGVTVNGDFTLDGATLAITGDVGVGNLVYNSGAFDFGGTGNTLTVGTYRQNGGTTALAGGDSLVADAYELNGGAIGFAMTNTPGNDSTVKAVGNTTTLNTGFTHTHTGMTEVRGGATLNQNAGAVIDGTEYLVVGGTMNMNDSVTTSSVTGDVATFSGGSLNQSVFWTNQGHGSMNMENAAYSHSGARTLTGSKAGTILTLTDAHSGFASGEIINWDTFPTFSGGDDFTTAFSGTFTPAQTGSYNFRFDCDDQAWMWIDMNDNGVFDSGENTGNLDWHSNGSKTLTAGVAYDFIAMAHEYGGGESVNWWVTSPGGAEDRVNPSDPAGNGGLWSSWAEWTGATRISTGGVLNIGSGAALTTANVLIDTGGTINVNSGIIDTADIQTSGMLRLEDGDALSDGAAREAAVTVHNGGTVDITKAGGLNRSSQMLIKKYGLLTGDLTNLAFSDTPGSGVVTFENRAILAPLAGTLPTPAQLGPGVKVLYGVQNPGDSVQSGELAEAVGGSTIYEGVYFGAPYAGGDYTGTITNELGSAENLLVVLNGGELRTNNATFASDTGTTTVEVHQGSRLAVGSNAAGLGNLHVEGFFDPFDNSGMNTTGQTIFQVDGNDRMQDGQNVRIDKGLFEAYNTEWPVTGGATVNFTFGPLAGMAAYDENGENYISDRVRRGNYIFEAGAIAMPNHTDRFRLDEARWSFDPDSYIALRDNTKIQDFDPRGLDGVQRELDNVNWIVGGADQLGIMPMGEGRRLTKFYNQNDRIHDNVDIVPSPVAPPTFVIFSSTGGHWNSNGVGGDLNIDAEIKLPGVDILLNDAINSSDIWIALPKNENDMTRRMLKSDGRINLDGTTIQAKDLIVRNGYVRFGANERDVHPTITGKVEVWDNGAFEVYAARGEGADATAATDAARLRYQFEQDTLFPGGINMYQGAYGLFFYRGLESASAADQDEWRQGHALAVPHEVKQTINVYGTGDVVGEGRTWSGIPMTLLRFDEEAGDGDGNNHVLFSGIVLHEGAHVGIQRASVDREELRLGVTLKGNALMERENDEWSFEDVNVENPGVDEYTLQVNRDNNGGQIDLYGTIGQGVTLMGHDTHFDFNSGADMEDGAVVANLGNQTPGAPGSDGYLRVFTGLDGLNPLTGGTLLLGGNQDLELIVNDHDTTQIVNNMGAEIRIYDDGAAARDGYIRVRRGSEDKAVSGKMIIDTIVLEGAATGHIDHNDGTDLNILNVDTGTGGGSFNANWGGHTFEMDSITGSGRLYNGIFSVGQTLAPGASAGALTVQNLITEAGMNYEMEFGLTGEDTVVVENDLTITDGWTLELLSDGGFADPGEEYDLFTWGGTAVVSELAGIVDPLTYTIVNTAGWDISGASVNYDAAGKRIYLAGVSGLDILDWNDVDGNWNVAGNWTDPIVPGANGSVTVARDGKTATVANPGQLAYAVDISDGTVDVDGGDLSVTANLDVDGFLQAPELKVTNGTLNVGIDLNVTEGSATVLAGGTANVDNSVNVAAGGTLDVSGAINTPTLNTAGITNLTGATGAIDTMNVTAGTATIDSPAITQLNVTGGTTNIAGTGVASMAVSGPATVNTTAAATTGDLTVDGGTLDLTNGGLTATTAVINAGLVNAPVATPLSVESNLTIGTQVIATNTGNAFDVSGTNVLDAHMLTLNGGTLTMVVGEVPYVPSVLFQVDHNDLPAAGASVTEWGEFNRTSGDPEVVELGGEKWYESVYQGTRLTHNNGAFGSTPVPINGATIVTAVKPTRHTEGNWSLVVDVFYDQLCLGINNVTGRVTVKVSGESGSNHTWQGGVIPEEPGVLSLTVGNGANPAFEVFWRGENDLEAISMGTGNGNTGGEPYTALYPLANGRGYAQYMNIGRNEPDGWSTYNGLIGDTIVYSEQLSPEALLAAQNQVRGAMGMPVPPLPPTEANFPNTTIATTVDSILSIPEIDSTVTLGGIAPAAGTTLTVDSPTTDIQLTNLSIANGATITSTKSNGVGAGEVDVAVSGTVTAGDGVGFLGVEGDDEYTHLTLGEISVVDWTFGTGADNYLDVYGDITFEGNFLAGVTINVIDGGGTAAGENVAIFRSYTEGFIDWDTTAVQINLPAGWTTDGLAVLGDLTAVGEDYEYLVLENLSTGAVATPGDSDGDGDVDIVDFGNLKSVFGLEGAALTAAMIGFDVDFDDDGDADLDDFATLRANWGTVPGPAPEATDLNATPEPATMSLLALGGLLIVRRRRRKA